MENSLLIITPSDPLAKFLVPVLLTLCPTSLEVLSREKNVFTRRHNNSIELEVKTATWPLYTPHASESTGKEGNYGVGWGD